MSLVAYVASSDEDSDCESTEETNIPVKLNQCSISTVTQSKNDQNPSKSLNLPQPKNSAKTDDTTEDKNDSVDFKLKLPAPRKAQIVVEEEDDEFLRKKVEPSLVVKPSKPKPMRQPVKITIPSLAELGTDDAPKGKPVALGPKPSKPSGLLSVLPKPRFESMFKKASEPDAASTSSTTASSATSIKPTITKTTSLVPHSVANKLKAAKAKPVASSKKAGGLGLNYTNSDDSDDDDDGGDFFSLNNEEKLPEVSAHEINAMVAKKASKMAEFSRNLQQQDNQAMEVEETPQPTTSRVPERDEINMEALIGARAAKRSRREDFQFIDVSQADITSNQEEWSRNQLQAETQYQPTGKLTTGDPGAGTKKKHQITYLAYQAKANEAELQAMWATNRQSRRQTQSKYGF